MPGGRRKVCIRHWPLPVHLRVEQTDCAHQEGSALTVVGSSASSPKCNVEVIAHRTGLLPACSTQSRGILIYVCRGTLKRSYRSTNCLGTCLSKVLIRVMVASIKSL
jgi:hypothetical protein